MSIDLALVWAGIIAFAVLTYVVMDGFDLGVGILFPFIRNREQRDQMINTVAPVWDGNETWLVMGGGGLFAVFPLAYATILPALYAPIIAMLLGLVVRGVAFEYRWRTTQGVFWDFAFFGGSCLAGFCQGLSLGTLVQGINVSNRAYSGGFFDWLTPFSITTGCAVVVGYALLGSTWLILKTSGDVRTHSRRIAPPSLFLTVAAMAIVSAWTPWLHQAYLDRWFGNPTVIFSVLVPLLVIACVFVLMRALRRGNDTLPFVCALALFTLGYIGVGISFYPYIVPTTLTIWEAAAPAESLAFLLVGTCVLLPIIVMYSAYSYWVFRGKIQPGEGYH
ncbi:cytochrome d ubiquinol oxidase subunit II (plasmid) [Rhizobium sp. CC1099]|uniref:cytochrome d ubiquinol oxidase subunit II n=1 Tax=Rhizobium sp. CC1099 TaxID=3039160 RepID=UPI0024B21720|nr:cytochrome d ubiquinol oxidase subunit II [Rhizobium sp. CC1099]WFU91414.1 cytochrome d ubiquinol oxidase subunit II [Rhizobium sp. CC1099]